MTAWIALTLAFAACAGLGALWQKLRAHREYIAGLDAHLFLIERRLNSDIDTGNANLTFQNDLNVDFASRLETLEVLLPADAAGAVRSLVNRMGSLERELVRLKQAVDFIRDQFDDLVSLMPDDPCRDAEPDAIDLANARPVAEAAADVFDDSGEWPTLNGNDIP